MTVAHELGKSLDEVVGMTPSEFAHWLAYFKIRAEEQQKAAERGRARRGIRAK